MAYDHEYSILGHSRATIGRHLGTIAGAIAALGALAAGAMLEWFEQIQLIRSIPNVILWPVTAGAVFALVHLLFDKVLWRWRLAQRLLNIPDLNGRWDVKGETKDAAGNVTNYWTGVATIRQTWERIQIRLETPTSKSRSKAAALMHEPGCHTLMYSYRNDPEAGEPMSPHVGYAEVAFKEGMQSAEGDYFNNKGRVTFGRMTFTKQES